jgi:hypothetical protein
VEKGGWGTETYIIDGGYLVIMTESGAPNLCGTGSGATYREFIQRPSGLAGVNHLKVQFNAFEHWTFPPQTLKCGSSCLASDLPDTDVDFGPQDGTDQAFVGTVAGFLYDCRPGRPCAGPPHAVEMIMKRDTWGSGAVQEEYYYARWRDPVRSNAWTSVGLVQWIEKTRQRNGTYVVTRQEVLNKLVQCSLTASCPSCP